MRADRLVATLLLRQRRGRVTAAELARELEVSVATARRDLEALSAAGIPVYPQPGRGGGRQLIGRGPAAGASRPGAWSIPGAWPTRTTSGTSSPVRRRASGRSGWTG